MTTEQFEILRKNQDLSDLHYPDAKKWMWDYCLFLGKFTDNKGNNYDLGVLLDTDGQFINATVYDNKAGSYLSGTMDYNSTINNGMETKLDYYKKGGFEVKVECWNRLTKINK